MLPCVSGAFMLFYSTVICSRFPRDACCSRTTCSCPYVCSKLIHQFTISSLICSSHALDFVHISSVLQQTPHPALECLNHITRHLIRHSTTHRAINRIRKLELNRKINLRLFPTRPHSPPRQQMRQHTLITTTPSNRPLMMRNLPRRQRRLRIPTHSLHDPPGDAVYPTSERLGHTSPTYGEFGLRWPALVIGVGVGPFGYGAALTEGQEGGVRVYVGDDGVDRGRRVGERAGGCEVLPGRCGGEGRCYEGASRSLDRGGEDPLMGEAESFHCRRSEASRESMLP